MEEFVSYLNKQLIFQQPYKLEGTGLRATNYLSPECRKTHNILVHHLKETRAINLKAYIKHLKVYINREPYTAKQLEKSNEFDSGAEFRKPEPKKNNSTPPTLTIQRITLSDLEEVFNIANNRGENRKLSKGYILQSRK